MSLHAITTVTGAEHAVHELVAKAEHAAAMFELGLLLAATDPRAARRWYRRAAETGHAAAMVNLGVLLAADDPMGARVWFERAAEIGLPEAHDNLAVLDGGRPTR